MREGVGVDGCVRVVTGSLIMVWYRGRQGQVMAQ